MSFQSDKQRKAYFAAKMLNQRRAPRHKRLQRRLAKYADLRLMDVAGIHNFAYTTRRPSNPALQSPFGRRVTFKEFEEPVTQGGIKAQGQYYAGRVDPSAYSRYNYRLPRKDAATIWVERKSGEALRQRVAGNRKRLGLGGAPKQKAHYRKITASETLRHEVGHHAWKNQLTKTDRAKWQKLFSKKAHEYIKNVYGDKIHAYYNDPSGMQGGVNQEYFAIMYGRHRGLAKRGRFYDTYKSPHKPNSFQLRLHNKDERKFLANALWKYRKRYYKHQRTLAKRRRIGAWKQP